MRPNQIVAPGASVGELPFRANPTTSDIETKPANRTRAFIKVFDIRDILLFSRFKRRAPKNESEPFVIAKIAPPTNGSYADEATQPPSPLRDRLELESGDADRAPT